MAGTLTLGSVQLAQGAQGVVNVSVAGVANHVGSQFDIGCDSAAVHIDGVSVASSRPNGIVTVNIGNGTAKIVYTDTDAIPASTTPTTIIAVTVTATGAVGASVPITVTNAKWSDNTTKSFATVTGGSVVIQSKIGDFDGDGSISQNDYQLLANAIAGIGTVDVSLADVTKDGVVDLSDLVRMHFYVKGLIPTL